MHYICMYRIDIVRVFNVIRKSAISEKAIHDIYTAHHTKLCKLYSMH